MAGDEILSEVKWIKITVGMFDDEKIKLIQSMPEGDAILVIWIRLICLAGKCNNSGYVYFSETMPYTEEMLSTIFNKPLQIIRLAIKTFQQFGMVEVDTKGLYLVNFGKHQSIDGLEKVRVLNAKRNKEYRERRKQLLLSDVTHDVSETVSDGTEVDIEVDKDKDIKNKKEIKEKTALESAVDDFKDFRKKIRSPMTDRAIQLFHAELNKLASDDETKIAIINQSIVKGYKGVFPLKDESPKYQDNYRKYNPFV
jgi:predicted phage replisome organizer